MDITFSDLPELARLMAPLIVRELNAEPSAPDPVWVDAVKAAELLHTTRAFVYAHADELGAQRIGTGPRPRLRFRRDALIGASTTESTADGARKPTRRSRIDVDLLPIRGTVDVRATKRPGGAEDAPGPATGGKS